MGIVLFNNGTAFATTATENLGGGASEGAVYEYTADLTVATSITLTGDFGAALGIATGGSGFAAVTTPTFGTFNFNTTDGTFTYTLTQAELLANGGDQTISFNVSGTNAVFDTDTINIVATVCFAPGTAIATPTGTTPVEALRIGDAVRTADGREVAVKWLGRQVLSTLFRAERMAMVRIGAGALGAGLPERDLCLTADHGMIIDGLVINAAALVNGDSIDFVAEADVPHPMVVYHVETENHEAILANGAPAETFVDAVTRAGFENYQEYLDLYGAERIIPEMDRPRISSRRLLPEAVRTRLGIGVELPDFETLSA